MPPTLPRPRAGFVVPTRGPILAIWATVALATAACARNQPPVAPGEPIPAAAEVVLDTMDIECEGMLAALATFRACPYHDDDDRWDIDAWSTRAREDFAAGKKAAPEPNAQHAIAAACRKAARSVVAATERCNNGPPPPRS